MAVRVLSNRPVDPKDVLPYPRCQEQIGSRQVMGEPCPVGKCTRRADHATYDKDHWAVWFDETSKVATYYAF